jgi:hypothetical protein
MKELGVGETMLLIIVPFLIVVFKPLWITKYFVILGGFLFFFLVGSFLNDEGFRKEFLKEGWVYLLFSAFFYFVLPFLFWWLVSKFTDIRKKNNK